MNNSTNMNMSDPWWLEFIEPEADMPHPVVITFIIIGTIGNIMVCLSVYLNKKLRNVTTYFLLSLAITDLLINVTVLPSRVLMQISILEPSHFPLCYFYLVGADYLITASALHICVISAQRYFAIKNPLNTLNASMRRVFINIGLIWLMSLLTVAPYIIIIAVSNFPQHPAHCYYLILFMPLFKVVLYVEVFVMIIVRVAVFFFFIKTSLILRKLVQKQSIKETKNGMGMIRTVGGNKSENTSQGKKYTGLHTEMKALRVVWLVSFAFVVTMSPSAIVIMVHLISPNMAIRPAIVNTTTYLTYSHSVLNPILYTIFSKRFRDSFKNILLCRFQRS